jgi:acyl transferase domain-containing protein
LAEHFKQHPVLNLADVAYTLQVGRKAFNHRRMIVCRDLADTVKTIEVSDPRRMFTATQEPHNRPLVFMFPGGERNMSIWVLSSTKQSPPCVSRSTCA